jgi:hypothetical protein
VRSRDDTRASSVDLQLREGKPAADDKPAPDTADLVGPLTHNE